MRMVALVLCAACGGTAVSTATFRGPVQVDATAPAAQPWLAFGQGRHWLAWQTNDATLRVGTRVKGGAFGTPIRVAPPPGWTASRPQLVVPPAGTPVLLFQAQSTTAGEPGLWAAALDAASARSPFRLDLGRATAFGARRMIDADEAGDLVAAWEEAGTVTARVLAGGAWTRAVALFSGRGDAPESVTVDAGAAGTALVGWLDAGTLFAEPVALTAQGVTGGGRRVLATDGVDGTVQALRGGAGFVLWALRGTLYAQRFADGGWSQTETVAPVGVSAAPGLALAANAKGEAVAVWRDATAAGGDAGAAQVRASSWDGTRWSPPRTLGLGGPSRHAAQLAVDLDETGAALVAWSDYDVTGTVARIWTDTLRSDGTWDAAVTVDSFAATSAAPPEADRSLHVAVDRAGGSACVAWLQPAGPAFVDCRD